MSLDLYLTDNLSVELFLPRLDINFYGVKSSSSTDCSGPSKLGSVKEFKPRKRGFCSMGELARLGVFGEVAPKKAVF